MNNMFSLIKAAFSQDMNIFKFKAKKNASKLSKNFLPIFLFLTIMFSMCSYTFTIAEELKPHNLTYIVLTMFILSSTIIALIEGIYKVQGILFEAKDNDLLFSLPIKKSKILFVRILKILVFQYVFDLMFLIPAFIAYVRYENPGVSFYLISFLMTFLVPIIPTLIAVIIGYIIKAISVKLKMNKIIQTVITGLALVLVLFLAMNYQNFIGNIAQNGESINDTILSIYYPIKLYMNLINNFNILDLVMLLTINIVPLCIFILIGSKFYFKIIVKNKEIIKKSNKGMNKNNIKKNTVLMALTKKELKRYFSCQTYMLNTSFGLFISVIISVLLCIYGESLLKDMLANYEMDASLFSVNLIYFVFMVFAILMTFITACSVSLEGKTINITKSLPVSEKNILKSKLLMCFIIELPFFLISDLLFIIRFTPSVIFTISLFTFTFASILLSGCIGLIVNLKHPKMDASSDTEVVKQSMSTMICSLTGITSFVLTSACIIGIGRIVGTDISVLITTILFSIITIISYCILMKTGPKKYKNINV